MAQPLGATRAARLKRGVGAGRSAQRGTSGATTGPRGARSAPPNPDGLRRNFLLVFFVPLVDTPRHEEYTTNQTAPWKPSFSRVSFSAHCLPWRRSRLASLATARRTLATAQRTLATE